MKNILIAIFLIVTFASASAKDYHVSILGNDTNPGTCKAPFKTLEAARNALRESGTLGTERCQVIIHEGVYRLTKPFELGIVDSGEEEAEVTYKAAEGEKVVFTSARVLNLKWKEWQNGIFKAKLKSEYTIDQLFVNGELQYMARYPNYVAAKIDSRSSNHADHKTVPFNGGTTNAWSKEKANGWDNPTGAYMHAMHRALWGDIHYEVTGKNAEGELEFIGGWQNNRVDNISAVHKRFRMIENVFEELDAPGEWYYNKEKSELYYYPLENISMDNIVVEGIFKTQTLVKIQGDFETPVKTFEIYGGNGIVNTVQTPQIKKAVHHIRFEGIEFTGTARSFMDNKEALLRSDWTIFRGGAFHIHGAEDVTVKNCTFKQLGGNAVFVDGYNRRVAIKSSIFEKNGATDVNFVGSPAAVREPLFQYHAKKHSFDEIDTEYGPKTEDFPADCLVEDCLMTQCGRVEKQTAGVNISMSSRITIRHNTIYHVPRAAINICDGTWGGHLIEWNKCFETVLETGDHGAFNSWGRDRFWHWATPNGPAEKGEDGVPRITKMIERYHDVMLWDAYQTTTLRNNLWICDNGWDVDLDDGSSNYEIYNNLCLRGGMKTREGYHRNIYNNVIFNFYTCNVPYPKPTYDQFRSNILLGDTYVSTIATLWGGSRDYTLFHNPEYEKAIAATAIQEWTMDDENSIVANANFIDPENGNFNVKTNSPAFALGFKNFPISGFGVTSEHLKKMAPEPEVIMPKQYFNNHRGKERTYKVLGATISSLDTQSKLTAYGAKNIGGAILFELPDNSDFKKVGFKLDDVILQIDDKVIRAAKSLDVFFKRHVTKGATYKVKVLRGQEEIEITTSF